MLSAMPTPTDFDPCSRNPAHVSDATLTASAVELVAAARRLCAASESATPAADDARAALALIGDALGDLATAAEKTASRVEHAPAPSGARRATSDTARRMHELVSSLYHARFSAHVAARAVPPDER
jgi:hypothetical protein